MSSFEELDFSNTMIENISVIEYLPQIAVIKLVNTKVKNIESLLKLNDPGGVELSSTVLPKKTLELLYKNFKKVTTRYAPKGNNLKTFLPPRMALFISSLQTSHIQFLKPHLVHPDTI